MSKPYHYGNEHRKLRKVMLAKFPLCKICNKAANELDHIIPINHGGDRYNESNLQTLCKQCHSKKSEREKHEYIKPKQTHDYKPTRNIFEPI